MAANAAAKKPQKRKSTGGSPKATTKATTKAATKSTKKASAAKKKPTVTRRARTARTTEGNVVTPQAWGISQRTAELADALGGVSALARVLDVSPSQPSRWKSGKERPGPELTRRLLDLDHVVARAGLVWHPKTVRIWLTSPNGHLNGATPMGVLATRGPADVLTALDAAEQGAFA